MKREQKFPPITLPNGTVVENYTITLTFRRAADLEAGMPGAPAKLSTKSQVQGPGPETKINIYAGTGENAELSNFAVRPFIASAAGLNEEEWPAQGKFNTVEGAYQAQKIAYTSKATEEENKFNLELLAKLRTASGAEAKSLGRQIKSVDTKDWDKDSSIVMENLLLESFDQNPDALAKLLATGEATLTHTQDKGKWGKEFPKLLMEVRDELRPVPQVSVAPTQRSKQNFIADMRGPEQLVDYETGNLIPVAKVYRQTQFIKRNDKGVETGYELSQDRAKEIMDENPNNVFVFDWFRPHSTGQENSAARNNTRQAWRLGLATGQSFGLTTRTFRGDTPTDEQFERVKEVIDEQIQQLVQIRDSGKIITFPSDGIGQNFKEAGADQIFVYLSKQLLENFGYRNPVFDTMSLADESLGLTGLDYIQDFYKKMVDAESGELAQTTTDSEVREHIKTCKLK
jgi:predicted NAD-dependent protein-ADP-ribosyltransferase YbiA (DUF1768 family)